MGRSCQWVRSEKENLIQIYFLLESVICPTHYCLSFFNGAIDRCQVIHVQIVFKVQKFSIISSKLPTWSFIASFIVVGIFYTNYLLLITIKRLKRKGNSKKTCHHFHYVSVGINQNVILISDLMNMWAWVHYLIMTICIQDRNWWMLPPFI